MLKAEMLSSQEMGERELTCQLLASWMAAVQGNQSRVGWAQDMPQALSYTVTSAVCAHARK